MNIHDEIKKAFTAVNIPTPDYSDNDIIIMDNIREVSLPNPVRLSMNMITVCVAGHFTVDVNGNMFTLDKNQVLLCPPGVTYDNFKSSPDFECKCICVTQNVLQDFLRDKINVWNEMMYVNKMRVKTLEQADVSYLIKLHELLRSCLATDGSRHYRNDIIRSMLRAAMLFICSSLKSADTLNWTPMTNAGEALFQRFLNLVAGSDIKHRPVEEYAAALGVSAKYLSTSCKRASGKTATQWIAEYTKEDIRYYLTASNMSIKAISERLGFANASFFGKYVKQHFGVTPATLRKTAG